MKNRNNKGSIRIVKHEPLATVFIDRPDKLNALTMEMRLELRKAVEALDSNPSIRVIIVRGEGNKAFSAGADIAEFLERTPEQLTRLHEHIAAPQRCRKPVIAAVNGYCFGGAFEFSLACDFIVATENSEFALPEIRLGMIPGSGGSQRIAHRIGIARTKDMIMRGRRVGAKEAMEWGLISCAVPEEEWEDTVEKIARELTAYSPLALRILKEVINGSEESKLSSGMKSEGAAFGLLRSSEDFEEGVRAFMEKRKAIFKGR